jgi:quinol monooxygenase YgiN
MIERNETRVVVIAQFTCKEGMERELLESLHSLMAETHAESGCLRYELNQDRSNPNVLTFIEKFADQAAFDAHVAAPYIKNYFDRVAPRLVEKQAVTFHTEILP